MRCNIFLKHKDVITTHTKVIIDLYVRQHGLRKNNLVLVSFVRKEYCSIRAQSKNQRLIIRLLIRYILVECNVILLNNSHKVYFMQFKATIWIDRVAYSTFIYWFVSSVIRSLKHCHYCTTGLRNNHNCNMMQLIKLVINRIALFTIVICK